MHLFDLINNQEQYFPTTGILLNTHTIAQDTKKTNMLIKTITIQISKPFLGKLVKKGVIKNIKMELIRYIP